MAEYLVTGGTSFIASHVVKALLDLGHSVRTTVRDSSGTFRSLILFAATSFVSNYFVKMKRRLGFYGS